MLFFLELKYYFFYSLLLYVTAGMNTKIKDDIKLSARKNGEDEIKVAEHVPPGNNENTLNTPDVSDASNENTSDVLNANDENTPDVLDASNEGTSDYVPNANNENTPDVPDASNGGTSNYVPNVNNENLDAPDASIENISDVPNANNEDIPDVADASNENTSDVPNANNENTLDVPDESNQNTLDVPNVNNEDTPDVPDASNENASDVPNANNENTLDVPDESNQNTSDVPNVNNEDTPDVPDATNENISDVPNENNEISSENNDKNSTWKEVDTKNFFNSLTFDLSQDVDHYMSTNNDILKALEAVKGRDFTAEEINKFKIWPQGIVPYFIDSMSFDKVLSDKIRDYLDVTNGLTGLRFRELPRAPSDDDTRYVFFVNRRAWAQCMDYTYTDFSNTGIQRVIIGYDCLDNGREIAKIVMALLGIPQQHNAPDRDTYVEFNEKAVLPNKTRFYTKVNGEDWLFKDIDYDFRSITHLPFYKNSIDGHAVLKPLKPVDDINVGESKGFSYSDLHKIRLMYNSIKTKSDEKIQYSNCQKLYKPGYIHKPEKLAIQKKDRDPQNEESPENDAKAYDNENPPERPMGKQGIVQKLSNRIMKQKHKLKLLSMKDDPLKWEDVRTD